MPLISGAHQLLAVTFQAGPVDWSNPIGAIFGLIERGLGSALAFIFGIVGNYGLSIIILTVILRLLLFPIYARSTKSMRKMQLLQPEIKKLQERYKGDRQKLAEEQMALFKVNQVSPVSGCLPLIAQAPIFMAMYRVINSAQAKKGFPPGQIKPSFIPEGTKLYVGLKRVTLENPGVALFLGLHLGMTPLQAYRSMAVTGMWAVIMQFVLVAAIVFTGWFQQKQIQKNNEAKGNQQDVPQVMQTMTKVFPVMFGLISLSLPAGVNLYFLTTNVFQIVQQYLMLKRPDNFEIIIPDADTKARLAARSPAGRAAAAAERRGASGGKAVATTKSDGSKKPALTSGKGAGSGAATPAKKKRAPKPAAPKAKQSTAGTAAKGSTTKGSTAKADGSNTGRKPVQTQKGGGRRPGSNSAGRNPQSKKKKT